MTHIPEHVARPITLRTLPSLAWRTAISDRETYHGPGYSSVRNLAASVFPAIRAPLFVIGAPRSGTTFLGRCVAALPSFSYHFEPVATKTAARYVCEGLWGERRSRVFYRAVYRWLLRIHMDGGKRFAEKTPRNCFTVGFLYRTFPDAQFLYIVRDGRDAALSHREKPWLRATSAGSGDRETGGYAYGPYPRFWVEPERREEFSKTTDLRRCLWAWRRHNEAALEHFASIPSRAVHRIAYEDFVRYQERESDHILDFLGIHERSARESFLTEARRGSTRSVGRWRGELTAGEIEVAEQEAGALLRRFGYAGSAIVEP